MLTLVIFLTLFFIGLIRLLTYYFTVVLVTRKKCSWVVPAPAWPILGSALEFGGHTELLGDMSRLTDNPTKSCYLEILLGQHNILTRDYDLMEFVMSSNAILDKSPDYNFLNAWLGTGLLTSPGAKWKTRRKVITPSFHFSILEQYVDVFDNNANLLIQRLKSEADGNDSVDIYHYVTLCALDVICESAMGVKINAQNDQSKDYVFAVKDMCRIATDRTFSIWKKSDFGFRFSEDYKKQNQYLKVLHSMTNSVITQRRKELNENKDVGGGTETKDSFGRKRKMAFLDLLLNSTVDGKPLSQDDIREEVDTFMFEGHDTTSSAISSALYLLANHPDVQELVRKEQKEIFGNDRDRATTYQDLQDMKYLELVIKETLRLYPSVPIIARNNTQEIQYKGHVIPKDTVISLFIYGINRDPEYYENPEEFRPERFLDTAGKKPFSFVPFSAGPRNCIGQKFAMLEMKDMISKVIKHFELFPTDPPHKLLLSSEAVLKSINGVHIRIKSCKWD